MPVTSQPNTPTHVDVLIVGAGISGVASAYHLQDQCPGKSFAIVDAQTAIGGTWITHKYPGLRSDSDLYTFGYRFKPWKGTPIATADRILTYLNEVVDENDLRRHIRFGVEIKTADWSSDSQIWHVEGVDKATGKPVSFTANFLWMCQGYYRHSQGYTPDWKGMADFKGQIVHPQEWPEDLDYAGKKVVVIGSGATAATLVPAIADKCAHVTMLQRSPTYFNSARNAIEMADTLRQLEVDEDLVHEITRRKVLYDQAMFTRKAKTNPDEVRAFLLDGVRAHLGEGFDIEKHFVPSYKPWSQRVAFVPDGDLFQAVKSGKASVVTDKIDRFTEAGIATASGEVLEADIIVTATGFNLCVMGDIAFGVDGNPVDFSQKVAYRGMMFEGVPNMLWVLGYFRASWTLRSELIADFVCRLLTHMDQNGLRAITPTVPEEDRDMEILPWIDSADFNPGYMMRGLDIMPRRGAKHEWQMTQDYWMEKDEMPAIHMDDPAFLYSKG